MPEGHTIHRLARDLAEDLRGRPVAVSSPQGRFDEGAARLDGATMTGAEAWGKHLFCHWDTGDVLHVHLGLIGKFRPTPAEEVAGETVRLRLEATPSTREDSHHSRRGTTRESRTEHRREPIRAIAWHLTGPQTCAVVTPEDRDRVIAPLGPDPLRRGARRRDLFVERLGATRRPVGAVLLDQRVVAGIGNVYRAELLFLVGVHPARPAAEIDADTAGELWDATVRQLKRGLAWNRIVTVEADDVGRRVTRRLDREDALYAYKRTDLPCRRCGTPIHDLDLGGRSIWFCPTCQPE